MKKLFYVIIVCELYIVSIASAEALGIESVSAFGFIGWFFGTVCHAVISIKGESD